MNSRRAFIFIGLLILAVLLVVFWTTVRQSAQRPETPPSRPNARAKTEGPLAVAKDAQGRLLPLDPNATREGKEPSPEAVKRVMDAYLAPITFYGKVVDEIGAPIAGAAVKMMANNKPLENSAIYQQVSDHAGLFSLHGARGAALSVNVSKDGYYSTAASKGHFVYGGVRGGDEPANPTASNPASFVLRKMGETVPLLAADRDVVVPKDGRPVEISLRTGRAVPTGQGDIVVECWTNNEGIDPNKNERFDWRMRLTVPNGGLIERSGEFTFVAPEVGYRPGEDINMPKDAENWRSTFQREYFVKTRSSSFARINFRITAAGEHFVTIKSHLNPTPGSRNLEFDPAKIIAPSL